MRQMKRMIAAAAAVCMLAGCSQGSAPAGGRKKSASKDGEQTAVESIWTDAYNEMPLVEITTKSDANDVMNFVTDPVAEHVSAIAAQWDPSVKNAPEPYYEDCTVIITAPNGKQLVQPSDAEVKVRGNWTTIYDKKPLKIKFSEKQSIHPLNGDAEFKEWVLLACYKDGSLMRDKTAFDISKTLLGDDGCYSSDCQLVEVFINGLYWGVYLLAEQQEVRENRVDVTKCEKDYTGTDIGYLLEYDGYYYNEDELHSFYVDYDNNAPLTPFDGEGGSGRTMTCLRGGKDDVGISIKSDINSQEQHDFIASYVNNVYTIMYEAAYNDKAYVFTDDYSEIVESSDVTPQQAVEKVVNVRSLADTYILCELACDADLYWSSFYMAADFGADGDGKLTFEAPWDFDSAFGNKDRCASGEGFYAANILTDVNGSYQTINPWLAVLMYEDWYQDIIRERWTSVYDSGAFSEAVSNITADSEKYSNAIDRNYDNWNNILKNQAGSELCARSAKCKTQKECAEYFAEWLETRVEFLNGEWYE